MDKYVRGIWLIPRQISKAMLHRKDLLTFHLVECLSHLPSKKKKKTFCFVVCYETFSKFNRKRKYSNYVQTNIDKNIHTTCPFRCADLDSLSACTPPPTDVSSQQLHFASPPQKLPFGCIMRTPFVVRPSISYPFSRHFEAFSCQIEIYKVWTFFDFPFFLLLIFHFFLINIFDLFTIVKCF